MFNRCFRRKGEKKNREEEVSEGILGRNIPELKIQVSYCKSPPRVKKDELKNHILYVVVKFQHIKISKE